MFCWQCGGNASEVDHVLRCCGQQGRIEAAEPEPTTEPEPDPVVRVVVTLPTHRATSIDAFYSELESGSIKTRRHQTWSALAAIGIATANEVARAAGLNHYFVRNVFARLSEMRDLGLVREVGERVCTMTGKTCIAWAIVPPSEYVGQATVHRCPHCNQIMSRDVPQPVGPTP